VRSSYGLFGSVASCLVLASCTVATDTPPEPVASRTEPIHSSHAGSPPWKHVLTCYGGCEAPHYDSSACNHNTSCGPIANGKWWYATERAAFHCGAKLKLVRGSKCVVVDVEDNGPADWVESNADAKCGTPYIIDTSPLVHDYFGGGCGWGECFLIDVYPVADNTPTGPDGCNMCDCTAGHKETAACGNCGTRTRTCGSDCHWDAWSACEGQGPCAPGQKDSRACCDCGGQSRTCGGSCQWGDWSTCAGPDPNGGNDPCDTGEPGPCAQGHHRCQQGCLRCVRTYDPVPERCDSVDNDCNAVVDDGNPSEMGDPPPAYAALLQDYSLRPSMAPGQVVQLWVGFKNVGTKAWPAGKVWLSSRSASQGQGSALYARDYWPAWDVAAVIDHEVAAGSSAFLAFWVQASDQAQGQVHDEFRLVAPDGIPMACPSPSIDVTALLSQAAPPQTSKGPGSSEQSGCGCRVPAPASASHGAWWAILSALGLAARGARRYRIPARYARAREPVSEGIPRNV
jgi:hypothetical protein